MERGKPPKGASYANFSARQTLRGPASRATRRRGRAIFSKSVYSFARGHEKQPRDQTRVDLGRGRRSLRDEGLTLGGLGTGFQKKCAEPLREAWKAFLVTERHSLATPLRAGVSKLCVKLRLRGLAASLGVARRTCVRRARV